MAVGVLARLAGSALTKAGKKESTEVAKKGTELIGRRPARDMGMVEDVTPKRLGNDVEEASKKKSRVGVLLGAAGAGAAAGATIGAGMSSGKAEEKRTASQRETSSEARAVATGAGKGDSNEAELARRGRPSKAAEASAPSSFGAAFKEARKAGDKTFMYEGKKYTTETADEKKAVSTKATGVREGRNENIDDDTRKRAMDSVKNLNKGGMATKYANCGASMKPQQSSKK